MNVLTAYIGIPGSGKSTFADKEVRNSKELNVLSDLKHNEKVKIERDEIRAEHYETGRTWSPELEKEVTEEQTKRIIESLKQGKDVIVSDTNINIKTRKRLENIAKEMGAHYNEVIMNCPFDLAMKRNKERTGWKVVPDDVMEKMYVDFTEQFPKKVNRKIDLSENKHKALKLNRAYIFDIDGTLAHMEDKRKPYDWNQVGIDSVDENIKLICNALYESSTIILVSGRDSICYNETFKWLKEKGVNFHELYMRPANNNIKDSVLKHDLYFKYIHDQHNVVAVFDDRPQVCRMWRKMGLKVCQVGDPKIEF